MYNFQNKIYTNQHLICYLKYQGAFVPLIAIADANNFYCSVERVFNPALSNKPVIVLSNNDGCVISRSNEAKQLGIKMAQPFYQIKALCQKNQVYVFSSNYALYGDMSRRIMNSFAHFIPKMEVYSIDEAFLDFSALPVNDIYPHSCYIKQKIKQWTGVPVAIGIASTKTLAKLANHIAKKKIKTGVFYLANIEQEKKLMQQLEVSEIWGVGRQYQKKLMTYGIKTVWDFYQSNSHQIEALLGINGKIVLAELNGLICHPITTNKAKYKNILSSRSFSTPTSSYTTIAQALSNYVVLAVEKMRKQQQYTQAISVHLSTNPHRINDRQYYNKATLSCIQPCNDTANIISLAKQALLKIYRSGYFYQKVGITLLNLTEQFAPLQADLFEQKKQHKRHKQEKLMQTIDQINQNMGKNKVFFAAQGIEKKWMMQRNYQSPHYTSDWEQLLRVS